MMFFGFFWLLLLVAIAVAAIYYLQSSGKGKEIFGNLSGQKEDALEILKTRYAKGEISKEEYEKMRIDLVT